MRGARAGMPCLLAALALSGCIRTTGPGAVAPQSELDAMAYRQSYGVRPAPTPVAYAAAPMPAANDDAYRLDAGDKLRVVVYGQDGLTNTYAIDAGGSITVSATVTDTASGVNSVAATLQAELGSLIITGSSPRLV